jgi:hydrogenase maturation protein HypF
MTVQALRIHISGIVQGVGFRPFVYSLAARLELCGWVRNTSAGVDIEVDGPPQALADFTRLLRQEAPPLARIDELAAAPCPPTGLDSFQIVSSASVSGAFQPISPDASLCPHCLGELFNPSDRRFRYPFINCTNCGPRFTIIQDIPYDRPKTTMSRFPMCPACASEYQDPLDRRFHAQPVACPDCGPQIWLEHSGASFTAFPEDDSLPAVPEHFLRGEDALQAARRLLAQGKIVAVKGLGGFHLACDAENPAAVAELRRRKLRVDKPFALMVLDGAAAARHCELSAPEQELLESSQRPIVLLQRRRDSSIARETAPNQETLGVMLPYTPLHYLLLEPGEAAPAVLVMTSANLSEEPIAVSNAEARQRLAYLADAFLMHDRPIHIRCDDSVMRVFPGSPPGAVSPGPHSAAVQVPLRRSRGYAPFPVHLPWQSPALIACGAELKNTFCLTRDRYAFLSHHIGDLENYETLRSFEEGIAHFEHLFRIRPEALAYDMHPNYLATRYALERAEHEGLPAIGVQHHHAHAAACMAENGLSGERPVIAVSFDGTGYGTDGAIWGGEFLVASYTNFERPYHLAYMPLPGGDAAVRRPARTALGYLHASGLEWQPGLACLQALSAQEQYALQAQLEHRINTPLTSSAGRLFDAVSALAGVRQEVNYEGQAAIELEALIDPSENGAYPFDIHPSSDEIGLSPLFEAVLKDVQSHTSTPVIAARFHNGLAHLVFEVCRRIRQSHSISEVALSGGVWQNQALLARSLPLLRSDGFTVYIHSQAPANDGGLSLGQAAVASRRLSGA